MKEKTLREKIILWIVFALFAVYAFTLIFPFIWIFYNSFKNNGEFFKNVWALPSVWRGENWLESFELKVNSVSIAGMYGNSLVFVIVNTVISMTTCSMTAYALSKYEFRGKGLFYSTAILIMLIPSVGSIASLYKLYTDVKLYDTYLGIFIMSAGGFGMGFLLLYGYFKNLSWSYAEAAFVDGAGDWTVFLKIMMPMALPALGAVGIISSIGTWNDFFTVYMYAPSKTTVAVGLNSLVELMKSRANYPKLFAAMLLSLVPILALFIAFNKTIMENTVAGGLKG